MLSADLRREAYSARRLSVAALATVAALGFMPSKSLASVHETTPGTSASSRTSQISRGVQAILGRQAKHIVYDEKLSNPAVIYTPYGKNNVLIDKSLVTNSGGNSARGFYDFRISAQASKTGAIRYDKTSALSVAEGAIENGKYVTYARLDARKNSHGTWTLRDATHDPSNFRLIESKISLSPTNQARFTRDFSAFKRQEATIVTMAETGSSTLDLPLAFKG